jgi:hypothetical protein
MNGKDGNSNDAPEQFKQYAHGTLVHQGTGISTTVEALNDHNDNKAYLASVDRYNDLGERDDNGMYDAGGNRLQVSSTLLPLNPLGDLGTDHTDGMQHLTDVDGNPINQEGSAGAVLTHVIDANGAAGAVRPISTATMVPCWTLLGAKTATWATVRTTAPKASTSTKRAKTARPQRPMKSLRPKPRTRPSNSGNWIHQCRI